MIELLPNLPPNVVGVVASGLVTANDYETVLIPAIEAHHKEHGTVRLLYQVGPAFSRFTVGAMWDDARLGLSHLRAWEKVAVVTDVEWIAGAVNAFRFAMPCSVRVFPNARFADAVSWMSA